MGKSECAAGCDCVKSDARCDVVVCRFDGAQCSENARIGNDDHGIDDRTAMNSSPLCLRFINTRFIAVPARRGDDVYHHHARKAGFRGLGHPLKKTGNRKPENRRQGVQQSSASRTDARRSHRYPIDA